jgi:hypothetical protein
MALLVALIIFGLDIVKEWDSYHQLNFGSERNKNSSLDLDKRAWK